jgi:hypothetical protein
MFLDSVAALSQASGGLPRARPREVHHTYESTALGATTAQRAPGHIPPGPPEGARKPDLNQRRH